MPTDTQERPEILLNSQKALGVARKYLKMVKVTREWIVFFLRKTKHIYEPTELIFPGLQVIRDIKNYKYLGTAGDSSKFPEGIERRQKVLENGENYSRTDNVVLRKIKILINLKNPIF